MELARHFRRRRLAVLAGAVLLLAIAGAAYATIPDGKGVFTACVDSSSGAVRMIDPATGSCAQNESQVSWNEQGQPGVSPTVTQLQTGDSHCPAGGAAITDGTSNTAYVCSAQTTGTFSSPDGRYSLAIGDAGLTMKGPGSSITISGDSISVSASGDETITVGHDRSETIGNNETITVGSNRSETVGSDETITIHGNRTESTGGALTLHGGKGCRPVARLGDSISVSLKQITSGSPSMCVP